MKPEELIRRQIAEREKSKRRFWRGALITRRRNIYMDLMRFADKCSL